MTKVVFTPLRWRLTLALTALALVACNGDGSTVEGMAHDPTAAAEEYERGPHNGRLLRDGSFALEITIFETGVPPEFRVYPFRDDAPVDPASVDVVIELGRLGPRVDRFEFSAEGDYLRGAGVVLEPHSFAVTVMAKSGGREYRWHYESFEGRTQIEPAVAAAQGVEVATAGPGTIRESIAVRGVLNPDPDKLSEVHGRFAGQVQLLTKSVGDSVRRGELLARVLSNESLQSYEVAAPMSGTVIERQASAGSAVTDAPIYVIADTSNLVADFRIFPIDIDRVATGQAVTVQDLDGDDSAETTISRLLPTVDPVSRAVTARASIDNASGSWRPGQFVEGNIIVDTADVPLAVRESGLQAFRDFTVVYARVGDTYEVRMLDLGRSDGEFVEVLGGLEPGTVYVAENSYLIKADIEKSGASHDH